MEILNFDIVVIGGGPAGLAALDKASNSNLKIALIERDKDLGGILKQCIHDGFGLAKYKTLMTGPEYAQKAIDLLNNKNITYLMSTFVFKINDINNLYEIEATNEKGAFKIITKKIIFATGCRERTAKQILISGTNPSGVMTAGQAQYFINRMGLLPGKEFVILGSGDIGLIMARRISLEGGHVYGVYEVRPTPSGLTRNIIQCLNDFNIPLHLSTTVTRLIGEDKLEAVEIAEIDQFGKVKLETKKIIPCDCLILSVGLVPENELAETLNVKLSSITNGIMVDQNFRSITHPRIFACGNAVHVFDLVDYCSQSGEIAGIGATLDIKETDYIDVLPLKGVRYVVPNKINLKSNLDNVVFNFRSDNDYRNKTLRFTQNNIILYEQKLPSIKMAECQKLVLDLTKIIKANHFPINVILEDQ